MSAGPLDAPSASRQVNVGYALVYPVARTAKVIATPWRRRCLPGWPTRRDYLQPTSARIASYWVFRLS